jgi:hypothetical protein
MTGKSASEIQNAGSETLNSGAIVFIIGGPRDAGGTRTWLMTTEAARAPGWFPAQDANGDSTITALSPNCPDTTQTLTLDDLRPLGRIGSLACFGSTDIQLTGHVECLSGTEDGGLGGTSWQFDGVHCYMGGDYTIYGKAMTRELDQAGDAYPLAGTYLVRGHFDDPESNNCGFYQFATSILEHVGDAAPVMECRKQFVATSVTKIDE